MESYIRNELGLETFFPRLRRKKTVRRVRREVTEALFPRYLFCKLDLAESLRAVTYGRDVINIVNAGGVPIRVSEATIRQIRDWTGKDDDVLAIEPSPVKKGDRVRVVDGPMQGFEAIFMGDVSRGERVAILLDLMNAEAKTEIDREFIEPVNG